MAVYYKFKSAKDYDSIAIDGHFITVGQLKEKIFESKHFGRGNDFDLIVTNAQTNEEYHDEATMVPKNTSVLISRIPGRPRMNIVTQPVELDEEKKPIEPESAKNAYTGGASGIMNYPDDTEWDEFGNDLYAIPEMLPMTSSNITLDGLPPSKAEEDSKIKALIETPALGDWQSQGPDGFGAGRGFGRGMGGRMMNGRGFGAGPGRFGMTSKTPPPGYVCHRCKTPGHFIQHCHTNGDPAYDIKRVKPPTGIPKSMLMASQDGSYALPSGAVAVLRPNEAAFEKEIEGLPSTRFVGELPPELHCPLCKEVMKDAVLTSKCCFQSFCDKCIRDFIISKSRCVCDATNVLADDLLPNKTVRDTINRILESNNNSSQDNAGSIYHVQDMESARPPPKIPSPTFSAASKGQSMPPPRFEETSKIKDTASEGYVATNAPQQILDNGMTVKVADVSETTHDSMNVKETATHMEEEVQQKVASTEAGKKKKKKKVPPPMNGAEMQWIPNQNMAPENFMMPMAPPAGYNPYWNAVQPGMDPFMAPYGGPMHFPGYMPGPMDMPFPGMIPHDPFAGQGHMNMMHQGPFPGQGHMMPFPPPQRDLADFGRGMKPSPRIMSREEFEARKADVRRKRELVESRDSVKDREFSSKVSNNSEMQSKSKSGVQSSSVDYDHERRRSEKFLPERKERPVRDLDQPPRPPKRKSPTENYRDYYDDRERDREREHDRERDHHSHRRTESSSASRGYSEPKGSKSSSSSAAAVDAKYKPSVFNRISYPEEEALKKRKVSSSSSDAAAAAHRDHRDRDAAPSSSSHRHIHRSSSSAKTSTRKSSSDNNVAAAAVMEYDYESSDEDRHFKRKPSRYEPSPPPAMHHSEYERDRYRSR